MAYEFKQIHRVEFAETDMAGIVHFSNFFRYMEVTEHAFFRSLGLSIFTQIEGGTVTWPRVHADCDYKNPLRFEEEVEILLRVREKKHRSLVYGFTFRKREGEIVAEGTLITVCVKVDEQTSKMKAVPIPEAISRMIEAAPEANSL